MTERMAPTRRARGSRVLPLAALLAVTLMSGCAVWRIGESAALARQSEPLQQLPPQPTVRLLIVGDSTAVGTGATSARTSIAGLMAQGHPRLLIENRAADGAKFADVLEQLQRGGRFDIVLVQAGGNDVIRLRSLDALRHDIDRTADAARERADHVVLMPAGNVGNAAMFFPPLSWWLTQRSRALHRDVAEAAARTGAVYVNLFHERRDDPFVADPRLNASDGLHPSDAGYELWWRELQAQDGFAARLAGAASP